MIHATIRMTMPRRKIKEAKEILHSFAEQTQYQPGCISCHIYHDVQERHVIMIEELWRSQEELERHLGSSEYRKILLVMEMAHEKPEIRFSACSNPTGIETIEKARSQTLS
jgi:quinol monooxygenase YgiN